MVDRKSWVITASGAAPLVGIVKAVQAAGGSVQSNLGELGVLIVQGSAAHARAWRKLPGVVAVEADTNVDVGPPGSDVS